MISNFIFLLSGGNYDMLGTIKRCSGCGVICDSSFIYWNPILQKEICYFEILKQQKEAKNEK